MKELIIGAYDLHMHPAPDVLPRKFDDLEMAKRAKENGMSGFAMKSHYFCTADRAAIVKKKYPDIDAVGTITLNCSVGGINPIAVEMAARAGTRLVWFPTSDSENEQGRLRRGETGKKLPYWAKVAIDMREKGIEIPSISVLDENGELTPETHQVLDVISRHGMILATSHLDKKETFALVKTAAKEHCVEHIILTHVDFPTTFYTVEEQKELLEYGAYMEHCFVTYDTGKVSFDTVVEQIRGVGAEHVILSTDCGQTTGLYPDEALEVFTTSLYKTGFSKEEIHLMTNVNQRKLLGIL